MACSTCPANCRRDHLADDVRHLLHVVERLVERVDAVTRNVAENALKVANDTMTFTDIDAAKARQSTNGKRPTNPPFVAHLPVGVLRREDAARYVGVSPRCFDTRVRPHLRDCGWDGLPLFSKEDLDQ